MNTKIFITLPIADLHRSVSFFKALGYSNNPQFSDETGACIVISDEIHVMVVTFAKFYEFTQKTICDTKSTEVLLCLSCESRAQVDDLVTKALASGGSKLGDPKDYGFMYKHSFQDPDGHQWALIHMTSTPPCLEQSTN